MEERLRRIEAWLTPANAKATLLVLGAITLALGYVLRNVELDHDFERFFPTDDPELDAYLEFRERFGNDNDFLLIALPHAPTVFDAEFLQRADRLAGALSEVPDVLAVTTPTRLEDPRITPGGVFRIPWLRSDDPGTLPADSSRIWRDERMRNTFFTPEADAMLVLLQTEEALSKERSDELLLAIEAAVAASGIEGIRMGGRVHGQYHYIQKMQRELVLFFSISVLLLTLFLFLGFRTLWGVLVPIGVVGLTVLWQVALMTLLGRPITVLTMLLPTILFVVGMSDAVHIIERYIESLRAGSTRVRALAVTYREVGLATLLTSVTTAIGFATLTTSGIEPIREFGFFTAVGVLLAFVLAFTMLPAILLLVPTPLRAGENERSATWYPVLHALLRKVIARRRVVPWFFLGITVVSVLLLQRIKVDNYLLEDWPEDDPQKLDYYWFDEQFGGIRPFDMEVVVTDSTKSVWDLEVLRDMEQVQEHLEKDYGIQAIISPVTVVKALNKAFQGGVEDAYVLPDDQRVVDRYARQARLFAGQDAVRSLVTDEGMRARMSGRMRDEGGYRHKQKNLVLEAFLKEEIGEGTAVFRQTGMAYLIDRNNEKLSGQLIGGLSIAFLLIALIMGRVFRDWRMTLLALVPNVVPLLFIAGVMGLVGIDLKVSTAIIFTIAFGIAVDDSIHMLGKLRIELLKGRTLPYAVKRSFLSAGKAVLITTIMLCSGFVALIFSGFASVFYMGLLISITLLMALVSDLVLLPPLLLMFMKRRDEPD